MIYSTNTYTSRIYVNVSSHLYYIPKFRLQIHLYDLHIFLNSFKFIKHEIKNATTERE
jgi:hypothetical protein